MTDEWTSGEDCCPHCLVEFDAGSVEWTDDPDHKPEEWHGTAPCPQCGETLHAYDVLITGGPDGCP